MQAVASVGRIMEPFSGCPGFIGPWHDSHETPAKAYAPCSGRNPVVWQIRQLGFWPRSFHEAAKVGEKAPACLEDFHSLYSAWWQAAQASAPAKASAASAGGGEAASGVSATAVPTINPPRVANATPHARRNPGLDMALSPPPQTIPGGRC